jgi:hypothetical protein
LNVIPFTVFVSDVEYLVIPPTASIPEQLEDGAKNPSQLLNEIVFAPSLV